MNAPARRAWIRVVAVIAGAVIAYPIMVQAGTASAHPATSPVTAWVQRHGSAVTSIDPAAPGKDLSALGRSVGGAQIVALGETAHRLAEPTTLKHRAVRYLVERLGFRTLAWEEDWSLGTRINDYLLGHRDDRDALVAQMSRTAWRTRQVADVLSWLRHHNDTHHDKVRFFGVEYFATRPFAYDNLQAYVAAAAPDILPQAREYLAFLRPTTDDMGAYLTWFREEVDDKQAYVDRAERLYDLVAGLADATAEHTARQIRSFYTAFTIPDNFAFRDARAAENLRWWQQHNGGKTIYWAAAAHTANVPQLTITLPPHPDTTFASVGSFMRTWYGDHYLSVGFTFDHGAIDITPGVPVELPAPPAEWFEHPLGEVTHAQFLYDLRRPAPHAVREWLRRDMLTRGYPEAGLSSTMSGGTPAQWFDVIVHRRHVTPAAPLT